MIKLGSRRENAPAVDFRHARSPSFLRARLLSLELPRRAFKLVKGIDRCPHGLCRPATSKRDDRERRRQRRRYRLSFHPIAVLSVLTKPPFPG